MKAFKDPRYIKVEGKPFFLVYSALSIPDCHHFFELWNKLAQQNGFPGIHFVGLADGWDTNIDKQLQQGYDAIVHGNLWAAEAKVKGKYIKLIENTIRTKFDRIFLNKYSYSKIVDNLVNDLDKRDDIYPCILPGWDRSPRSGRKATIYYGSNPDEWEKHVRKAVSMVRDKDYEHKIIILRSWNEWGEGNYVEPDTRWGHAYLDVLKKVLFE